jgi:hypothetical protein
MIILPAPVNLMFGMGRQWHFHALDEDPETIYRA